MRNEREREQIRHNLTTIQKRQLQSLRLKLPFLFEVYIVTLCHNIQTSLSFFNFGFRHILCINLGHHHTPSTFITKHSYPKKGEPMWLALIKY